MRMIVNGKCVVPVTHWELNRTTREYLPFRNVSFGEADADTRCFDQDVAAGIAERA
jgi:hypothetical protein